MTTSQTKLHRVRGGHLDLAGQKLLNKYTREKLTMTAAGKGTLMRTYYLALIALASSGCMNSPNMVRSEKNAPTTKSKSSVTATSNSTRCIEANGWIFTDSTEGNPTIRDGFFEAQAPSSGVLFSHVQVPNGVYRIFVKFLPRNGSTGTFTSRFDGTSKDDQFSGLISESHGLSLDGETITVAKSNGVSLRINFEVTVGKGFANMESARICPIT